MSIKDAIKSLEEADEKLKQAVVLETSAIAKQKEAAQLREESQRDLEKAAIEKSNLIKMRTEWDADFRRKEDELKNREVTLAAGKADLERNTAENNKDFDTKHAALDARTVAADKADRQNKEQKASLDTLAEKYKAIKDFITTTL